MGLRRTHMKCNIYLYKNVKKGHVTLEIISFLSVFTGNRFFILLQPLKLSFDV